jgi:hypothetical protein
MRGWQRRKSPSPDTVRNTDTLAVLRGLTMGLFPQALPQVLVNVARILSVCRFVPWALIGFETPPRKADPRQQQDWFLKGLQGGRAHPLAACRVATLCCSGETALETLNPRSMLHGESERATDTRALRPRSICVFGRAPCSPAPPRNFTRQTSTRGALLQRRLHLHYLRRRRRCPRHPPFPSTRLRRRRRCRLNRRRRLRPPPRPP